MDWTLYICDLTMNTSSAMTKYAFQVRSRNGVVVDNLQISGHDEEDAIRKLRQMYPHCEVLESKIVSPERASNSSYEEVLSLIVNAQ